MRRFVTVAVISFGLVLVGCGDDDGGGTSDAAPTFDSAPIADAALPDATPIYDLDSLCAVDGGFTQFFTRFLECNPELALQFGDLVTPASISAACYGQFSDYYDDASLSIADHATWTTCLDYIANTDCNLVTIDGPHPCRDVLSGVVPVSGDCEIAEQCAGDAYCDRGPASLFGPVTCGTCTARSADGIACDSNEQCSSFYCDETSNQCETLGDVGAGCTTDEQCLGRLVCGTGLTCEAPQVWAANDACTNIATDCGFPGTDLYCDETAGMCVNFLALNDPCGPMTRLCNVLAYETCDEGGTDTCVAPTVVGTGQACGFLAGAKCEPGSVCSDAGGGGTCFVPLGEGQNCSAVPQQCGFFLQCNGTTCEYGDYSGVCPPPS